MNKLILFFSCVLAVVADMIWVWWAKGKDHPKWILLIGFCFSMSALTLWIYSLVKGITAAQAITAYALLTIAGCTAIGYFVFNENLSTINWIGIGLAAVALVMISI